MRFQAPSSQQGPGQIQISSACIGNRCGVSQLFSDRQILGPNYLTKIVKVQICTCSGLIVGLKFTYRQPDGALIEGMDNQFSLLEGSSAEICSFSDEQYLKSIYVTVSSQAYISSITFISNLGEYSTFGRLQPNQTLQKLQVKECDIPICMFGSYQSFDALLPGGLPCQILTMIGAQYCNIINFL